MATRPILKNLDLASVSCESPDLGLVLNRKLNVAVSNLNVSFFLTFICSTAVGNGLDV